MSVCTTPHCHGLVTWVPSGPSTPAHYRCQGPCGRPYKRTDLKVERIDQTQTPRFTEKKEVNTMTEAEREPEPVKVGLTQWEKLERNRELGRENREKAKLSGNGSGNPESIPRKVCRGCGIPKPATLEFFHAAKNGKYGLKPICKECLSQQAKKRWAEKHPHGRKRGWNAKADAVKAPSVYIDPPYAVKAPSRDQVIAVLEEKVRKIQAAIEVIREAL
jgi:hypothetical protein